MLGAQLGPIAMALGPAPFLHRREGGMEGLEERREDGGMRGGKRRREGERDEKEGGRERREGGMEREMR